MGHFGIISKFQQSKSLINGRNSSGPRTLPCGTPDRTVPQTEAAPFRTTLCFLSLSHLLIQLNTWPCIPYVPRPSSPASSLELCRRPWRNPERRRLLSHRRPPPLYSSPGRTGGCWHEAVLAPPYQFVFLQMLNNVVFYDGFQNFATQRVSRLID